MEMLEIMAPCHFGLEAVVKRDIYDLGYEISKVEDGRVTFAGDLEAVAIANIWLRCAERILIKVGEFKATSFEELFEGITQLPWEAYIPKTGRFWVIKATSVKASFSQPRIYNQLLRKLLLRGLEGYII